MTSDFAITADDRGGFVVHLDGQPQSHVNTDDPEDLAFEYVAIAAAAVDAVCAGHDRVRVTHVGGAGLTLPRWVQHRWPGSPQIVLEPDAALTEAVRQSMPLPRGHRIRVRPVDGANGVAALADSSADVIFLDAYAQGRVPAELGALPFLAQCARVLGSTGVLVGNVADEGNGRYLDRVAAGVRESGLTHTGAWATSDVAKGRRFGNRILLGSAADLDRDAVTRALRRLPWSTAVVPLRPARPFTADDAEPSPEPPMLARSWRVR